MGIYLNPNNENFRMTLAADIYVDKSMLIAETNRFIDKGNKYICVSRPRRFGKTIASEMLSAYYSKGCDSDGLFNGLKISADAGYREKLNRYNVIKIDVNSEYQSAVNKGEMLRILTYEIKKELRCEFPDVDISDEDSLARSLLRVYSQTNETFIIIMDEYDVLVREEVDEGLFNEYLGFLNGLFKSATLRPAISLAYLTGILPIVRDRIQSKLNNFREYTILDAGEFSEFVGFTEEEVKELCEQHSVDFEECRRWYDGYRLRDFEIYNPESVVRSMEDGRFYNYWGKTSSYKVISDRIGENFDGTREAVIRMMAGESVYVNVTKYLNTMESFESRNDAFTYLIHVGYLAYDADDETCRIPNNEIRKEWENALSTEAGYEVTNRIIEASRELLIETRNGNAEAVARALDESHIHVTSNRSYNNEDALQSAIYLAYIYALNEYTVIREMTAGKGFADVVYISVDKSKPAMIIELKRNDSAESGLAQIRERRYFDSLEHFKGDMLLVGISYDEKTKTHECKIERLEKCGNR